MEHKDIVKQYLHGPGVEIGAFLTPIPGIEPIYVDRFAEYANQKTLADYYGDACALPFEDSSLGYVATSHVIEHVANPLAAFEEWYRVLKPGGIIYMVTPDRRLTFDRPRPLTSVEHLFEDYRRGVTQVDGTHIDDFVFGVDWNLFSPSTPTEQAPAAREEMASVYRNAIATNNEINIHFHTFELSSMKEFVEASSGALEIKGKIEFVLGAPDFPSSNPNGFLVIARVDKPSPEGAASLLSDRSPAYPLKADARKF